MTTLKSILKEAIEEVLTCNLAKSDTFTCIELSNISRSLLLKCEEGSVFDKAWEIDKHVMEQYIPFLNTQGFTEPTKVQAHMIIHALVFRDLDIGDTGENYTSEYINSIVDNHKDKCDELFKYYRIEWLNFLLENLDSLEE